jgi:hypothetical protein
MCFFLRNRILIKIKIHNQKWLRRLETKNISNKEKIDKLGLIKIWNFLSAKDSSTKVKIQAIDWGKNLSSHLFDKEPLF